MKKISLLLIIPSIVMVGCSKATPTPDKVSVKLETFYRSDIETYDLTFNYSDECFSRDAKEYDKDLSLLSFGATVSTNYEDEGEKFFSTIQFKDFTSKGYETEPTLYSIGYYLTHKSIGEHELFTVAVRGYNYFSEWGNNFLVGKTGDHTGFIESADIIYKDLQNYISTYGGGKQIKLWINGYSRAGGVANALASLILRGDKISVAQSNMFVYTFEAPNCLDSSNVIAYQNVHNIINENDLVASIPPAKFNIGRCGVDYYIYDSRVSTIIKEFDPVINLSEFVPVEVSDGTLNSDADLKNFILKCVFDSSVDEEQYRANTREEYVDHYQAGFANLLDYIFRLSIETRTKLVNDLSSMGILIATLLADETGETLAAFLKTYFDQDHIEYDSENLASYCAMIRNAVVYLFTKILAIYLNETYRTSLIRLVDMHFPETVYSLLLHKHKNS